MPIENLNDENDQLHLRLAGEDTTNSSRVETSKEATLPSMDETTESDDDTTEFDSILKNYSLVICQSLTQVTHSWKLIL